MRAAISISILAALALSGCTPHSNGDVQAVALEGLEPGITAADASWTPDQMSVICGEDECPEALGLLVFPGNVRDSRILISRCTAFATGSHEIRTAGHCDQLGKGPGYFVRVNRPISEPVKRVTRLLEKKYTLSVGAKTGSDLASGFPDYATFEIDSDLEGVTPLSVTAANDLRSKIFYLYVTRPLEKASILERQGLEFEVKRLRCDHRRDSDLFPYAFGEEVDVVFAFGCNSRAGDSGAPMISMATGRVEASLIGQFSDSKGRPAGSAGSNFRCFNSRCLRNDAETRQEHVLNAYQKLVDLLANARPRLSDPVVKYQTVRLQLVDRQPVKYEVIFLPKCRRDPVSSSEVIFPFELFAVTDTETGDHAWERLKSTQIKAVVERQEGDRFQVNVGQWPEDFDDILRSEDHPRVRWGARFSIDLPVCAR